MSSVRNAIVIAESCIKNEVGYMDLSVEITEKELVVKAENHDGDRWIAKSDSDEIFCILVESLGIEKVKSILSQMELL